MYNIEEGYNFHMNSSKDSSRRFPIHKFSCSFEITTIQQNKAKFFITPASFLQRAKLPFKIHCKSSLPSCLKKTQINRCKPRRQHIKPRVIKSKRTTR